MVGVVTHQRWQIECDGKSRLPLCEKITEAAVGVLGRAESRELTHGPQPLTVHCGMDSARKRRLAGDSLIAVGIPTCQVSLGVKPVDGVARDGGEIGGAVG